MFHGNGKRPALVVGFEDTNVRKGRAMSRRAKKNKSASNDKLSGRPGRGSQLRLNATASCGPDHVLVPRTISRNAYLTSTLSVLIVLAVVLVFGQTVDHGFVYDDVAYVVDNLNVNRGLSSKSIVWAFTHDYSDNWHPVTWISHMLDCQLYELRPAGHHITNVLLHAINSVLVLFVLRSMTGRLWPSAFVAIVFAIHPLRAESVAWVAERKDLLSGLFFMLTLWAYLVYVRRPFSSPRYLLVIVLFALGLMSKPMLVTLPFVLLLLDFWPLGRLSSCQSEQNDNRVPAYDAESPKSPVAPKQHTSPWRLILEKTPMLALVAISCVVTTLAQGESVIAMERTPLSERIPNAFVAYATYLRQYIFPVNLAVFYPHPGSNLPAWKVVLSIMMLAVITALAWFRRRRSPYLLVGWLWFLGMLVPVIGVVQVGMQAMADRYTYLPQIGLSIVLAWGAIDVVRSRPHLVWLCRTVAPVAALVLLIVASRQTAFWRTGDTLWKHTLACTTRNHVAHWHLGLIAVDRGQYDEAIEQYRKAIEITPSDEKLHVNLGIVYALASRHNDAIPEFERALKIAPNLVQAHSGLADALAAQGNMNEAILHLDKIVKLQPNLPEIHSNLGIALASQGRFDEAVMQFRKSLEIKSDAPDVLYNLGLILTEQGHTDQAVVQFQYALDLAEKQNNQSLARNVKAEIRALRSSASSPNPGEKRGGRGGIGPIIEVKPP
jgi:protein O-mannosyl-transferase